MFSKIEEKYKVIYPESENATYTSLLNYSNEGDKAKQRWYRYKEGFSIEFVKNAITEYLGNDVRCIMDPFTGSGSTMIAANKIGASFVGFEVNPFSFFLAVVKSYILSEKEVKSFEFRYKLILEELKKGNTEEYKLPALSFANKVFQNEVELYFMSCKAKIDKVEETRIKHLLLLGWISCIEDLSEYRKAGNGLKKRKTVKPRILTKDSVIQRLENEYSMILEDLVSYESEKQYENILYNTSCLDFGRIIKPESIDGIIFSPPYANCFDYTEIYKLELWFGGFISSYDDLKQYRKLSLKSHLNADFSQDLTHALKMSELLSESVKQLSSAKLWDKKIPKMITGYFYDMFNVIDNCYSSLRKGGFCGIVVGNSAYGGVIVPTDLILAQYAESIGFYVDKIEVDRYIITSSQQYEKTKKEGKYLRESVVCLVKK